jgi:hypothetical protein
MRAALLDLKHTGEILALLRIRKSEYWEIDSFLNGFS